MAKSIDTCREAVVAFIMFWSSLWRTEWGRWVRSRESQAAVWLWAYLDFVSFLLFILVASLNTLAFFPPYYDVLSPPGVLEVVTRMLTIAALAVILGAFAGLFLLILLVSFHPKTRAWADRRFQFKDLTRAEEMEARIGQLEHRLDGVEGTLSDIKDTLMTLSTNINKGKEGEE
jgi:hypothetical protein